MTIHAPNPINATEATELSEVDAIAALLDRLVEADAVELLTLARTCPAREVQVLLPRLQQVLAEVRRRLVNVVTEAHHQAALAEEWIASLEALAAAEQLAETAA